ncbi:hypothetical protein M378DRAFT_193902 [Amanita muscaria Koide BX008]|uniref:Uncharacterized protein n=1 Tax=Amanita muscaria (strain Koide BX008) TaxID=946122 RepID=A0A0C2WQS1_AMAMK|nr:hypothetical protein M378DRAFT_193902 [Amanita muscaria Koide BX008]
MSPLAGRPPYATDEPDSIYETPQPTRRIRQQPSEDPNKRTTAYDVYDNYLAVDDSGKEDNRNSGIGAVGAGLLTMDDDDEEESDNETSESTSNPKLASPPASKNAALAAATGVMASLKAQNQYQMNIASPRPGYAAPIAVLNNIPSPEPVAPSPRDRRPASGNLPNPFTRPSLENPFDPPKPSTIRAQYAAIPPSPSPASLPPSPHPLRPPMTPITPVFARPAKATGLTFEEKPQVPRTERTALPTRGEKGDDFWKRFSMVAREPSAAKESNWLKKTRVGYSSFSRWVWCVGLILLICVVGAIGIWVYISRQNSNHSAPTAWGGSANEAATYTHTATPVVVGSSTVRHVSPTNTVARRDIPAPTPANKLSRASNIQRRHKNRLMDIVF